MNNKLIHLEGLWLAALPPDLRDELEEEARYANEYLANNLLDCCPNRRVLHLARRGRKRRTRKKNMRRAYKMIGAKEVGI